MSKTVSLILQLFTCYGIYPVNVSRGISTYVSTYISTSVTSPPNDGHSTDFPSAYNFNTFRHCSADSTSAYNIPPDRRSANLQRITTQHPSRLEKCFSTSNRHSADQRRITAQHPSRLEKVSAHPTVVAQICRGSRPSIHRAPKCCQHKIFIFLYFYLIK